LVLAENLSLPGIAINNIAQRLKGDKVPFLDLMAEHDNLLNRIRRLFRG
jgi:septum site-determining protein MinD